MTQQVATGLHVFDMDGTLLHGVASVEISRHLGTHEEAQAVEEAWLRGEIDDVRFWDRMLPLWVGAGETEIDAAFEGASWIEGIAEVFADITARGGRSIVISQSPLFFVQRLQRWGAGATHGATVTPGGRATMEQLVTVRDKVDITEAALAEHGLTERECVAYGDSRSDVGLFEWLPHSVAVNASPTVRALATASYTGSDLREAYALGRALLDGVPAGQASISGANPP